MRDSVHFSCTTLVGTGKQGILLPDEDGYYEMPIGALNVFNSAGQYYTYNGAKDLFTSGSSAFQRRVQTGCLKGESGHPKRLPGQSLEDFAQRVQTLDEKNICVHFKEVWLDFDRVKGKDGKPVIAIMAKLTPSGPNGPALQKSLDNRHEEVCFSIRAWTEDRRVGNITERTLTEIVTFDNVTEPGIHNAKKFYSPSLENYSLETSAETDVEFTKTQLLNAFQRKPANGLAMESSYFSGLSLFQSLGWEFDKNNMPPWAKEW